MKWIKFGNVSALLILESGINFCCLYTYIPVVFRTVSVEVLETPLSPVMVREMVFSPLTNSLPLILKLDVEEAVGQKSDVSLNHGIQRQCYPYLALCSLH